MDFEPRRGSVRKHQVPEWYNDAKFGIFIHWSLSVVPAFAPTGLGSITEMLRKGRPAKVFENQPYSEWYLNSLRIEGSPVYEHHARTYGADYDYYNFADDFNGALGQWDPGVWADLFSEVGAKYVVFVTKHHDGFLLWPSENPNPLKPDLHATRDCAGELADAVKARGMRMGFYYSSPLDWTFTDKPITDFADLLGSGPTSEEYVRYAGAHWRELIDRYEPSVLWSDIGYPPGANLFELFSYFYNRTPDGVVNDRWQQVPGWQRRVMRSHPGRRVVNFIGGRMFVNGMTVVPMGHYDYTTPEYAVFSKIRKTKWECVRGMGTSFGYNRQEKPEDYISVPDLVRLLVDIVSKNGNLLLNVGPMLGGEIMDVQRERLKGLGAWLEVNGEAIYGTRPWVAAEGSASDGTGVRFTYKDGSLFAVLMDTPAESWVVLNGFSVEPGTAIELLGRDGALDWKLVADGLRVDLGGPLPESPAHALKITPAP